MSVTVLVFILDYFQEKLMTKCFKKLEKSYFGSFLIHFTQILLNKDFPRITDSDTF